ncbi:MAG: hypothetical protein PHW14_07085, partial [Candidatus Omnitrophica bacterium]|nr:hypothetical protein [Candidatus Omnitrophota bacterium]
MYGNKKRVIGCLMVWVCLVTVLFSSHAMAEPFDINGEWLGEKPEWAPEISAGTNFATKYVWRGQLLVDDPCVQPEVSISKWGLKALFWGNYNTRTKKSDDGTISTQEWTELDFGLDYTFTMGEMEEKFGSDIPDIVKSLGFSAGYIYYLFPNLDWKYKGVDTHEFYLGVSYDTLLSPWIKWYQDVKSGSGAYIQGGIGHSFELGNGISADLGMTAAYNYHQWTPKQGWSDMNFSGAVNIPVFHYFTVSPNMSYSLLLDRRTYEDKYGNEFYGGV